MTQVIWNGSTGNWTNNKSWSNHQAPGASDDVVLPSSSVAYALSVTTAIDVNSITQYGGTLAFNAPGLTDTISDNLSQYFGNGTIAIDSQNPAKATTLNVGGDLVQQGTLAIDSKPVDGGSALNVAGTLTATGALSIGNDILTGPTTVTVGHLAFGTRNGESIMLTGSMDTGFAATLIDTSDAASFQSPANASITLVDNALLEYASGSIQTIGAGLSIQLVGPHALIANASDTASNSALAGLTVNDGQLFLDSGASLATAPGTNMSNFGSIDVDSQTDTSSLSVGGALTNAANHTIFIRYNGASATVQGDVMNAGTIYLYSSDVAVTFHVVGDTTNTAYLETQSNGIVTLDGNLNNSASGSVSATTLHIGGSLTNSGDVDAASVEVDGGTTSTGTLEFTNWTNHGGITASNMMILGSLSDDTRIIDQSGNVTLNDALMTAPVIKLGGAVAMSDATITGTKITLGGVLHGTGALHGKITVAGTIGETFLDTTGVIYATDGSDKLRIAATGTVESLIDASGVSASVIEAHKVVLDGGILRLSILHPQDLAVSQEFAVIEGNIQGQFAEFQDANLITTGDTLDLSNGLTLELVYEKHDIKVDVVATPAHAGDALVEAFQSVDAAGNVSWQSDDTLLHHSSAAAAPSDFG